MRTTMRVVCAHCGKKADQPAGAVNRARRNGNRLFCGRKCAGLGRRKHKTKARRVEEKRLYDAEYRRKNRAMLKAKKAAYYKANRNPEKERAYRQANMARHVEYCRRPEYKTYKRAYDRQYRASEFGPFAEAYLLAIDLNREIKGRMTGKVSDVRKALSPKPTRRTRRRTPPRRGIYIGDFMKAWYGAMTRTPPTPKRTKRKEKI